jgi:hypothetical protein
MSNVGRFQRVSSDYSFNSAGLQGTVGIPWDEVLQPIFDAKCVGCHDGSGSDGIPAYQICSTEVPTECQSIPFDLRGVPFTVTVGDAMLSAYTASLLTLLGAAMLLEDPELNLEIIGEPKIYVNPSDAASSLLIQELNPMQLFPTVNAGVRRFTSNPHDQEQGFAAVTPQEMWLLVQMANFGGQFYSRENAPGETY